MDHRGRGGGLPMIHVSKKYFTEKKFQKIIGNANQFRARQVGVSESGTESGTYFYPICKRDCRQI